VRLENGLREAQGLARLEACSDTAKKSPAVEEEGYAHDKSGGGARNKNDIPPEKVQEHTPGCDTEGEAGGLHGGRVYFSGHGVGGGGGGGGGKVPPLRR